jgi:hypothetical protein
MPMCLPAILGAGQDNKHQGRLLQSPLKPVGDSVNGKHRASRAFAVVLFFLAVAACVAMPTGANARACSANISTDISEPATAEQSSVDLRCDLTLQPDDIITKRIVFSGEKASGAVLDCNGATLDGSRGTFNFGKPTVLIRSIPDKNGGWSVPSGISIRNCVIKGAVRVQGLGANGQAKAVKQSSLMPGQTARAQASAPSEVSLVDLSFIADGRIPLYLGPGVTGLTLSGSAFTGKSDGTVIYLDAESARNTISGNTFAATTKSREQIAIDGSADNVITDNVFENPLNGGIFLYRNCGEGGTIRHQKPQHNTISGNTFSYRDSSSAKPAVWLNSRNGWRLYCFLDPATPYGSSLSPLDFAQFNTVTGNRFKGGDASLIRNSDDTNIIEGNTP